MATPIQIDTMRIERPQDGTVQGAEAAVAGGPDATSGRDAIERAMEDIATTLPPTGVALYALLSLGHGVLLSPAVRSIMLPLSVGTVAVCAGLWLWVRRWGAPEGSASIRVGAIFALAVLNTTVHATLDMRWSFAVLFVVMGLGAGLVVLRWGALAWCQALVLAGWAIVVRNEVHERAWQDATTGLLCACAVGIAVAAARRRSILLSGVLGDRDRRLREHAAQLGNLVRSPSFSREDVAEAWQEITETAARATSVARASVWRFSHDGERLVCQDCYVCGENRHEAGAEISTSDYPDYFAAVARDRVIDASDAVHDPRTREMAEGYLVPLGISSMLDAPVIVESVSIGVLCLEHIGPARVWDAEDLAVAASLADAVAAAYQIHQFRELEMRMQEALRLESLGTLAGGVAHDFNNVLAAVIGNVDLLEQSLDPESKPALDEIREAAERGRELGRQMLAYSGRVPLEEEVVDLSSLVEGLLPIARARTSSRSARDVRFERPEDRVWTSCDPTQIRQIVLNFLTNACDASEGIEATITVRVGAKDLDARALAGCVVRDTAEVGRFCFVEVEDQGHGIDEETIARIFDPFFSTRPGNRGLGLAAVRGLVRTHRGALQIHSTTEHGTRVRLYLPHAEAPSAIPPSVPQQPMGASSGEGFVALVVEDESPVRRVARKILESGGFEVVEAENCCDAIAAFEAVERVDVALIDLGLPDGSGADLAETLHQLGLDPIVLSSGYDAAESLARQGNSGATFLAKPYRRADLLSAVLERLPAEQKPDPDPVSE